jgi:phosphoribosylanthranilate isomerase
MIKTKICGLTRKEDALFAAYNGADAIGVVNVRESTRYVKLSDAREIFRAMPPFVSRVLVASPERLSEVKEIERSGADYLQLHSVEDIMFIKEIKESTRLKLIKQLYVTGPEAIEQAQLYSGVVDAILLDTKTKEGMGGTGQVHDWEISKKIVSSIEKPVILAGGLNPANVLDAISKVRPYAVDVASGVETAPGIKDTDKIKQFLLNVKKYDNI